MIEINTCSSKEYENVFEEASGGVEVEIEVNASTGLDCGHGLGSVPSIMVENGRWLCLPVRARTTCTHARGIVRQSSAHLLHLCLTQLKKAGTLHTATEDCR